MNAEFLHRVTELADPNGLLAGEDIGPRYYTDWRGTGEVRPVVVFRPQSTGELSNFMKLCNEHGQPVVIQGGMTGLVEAARPQANEIPTSLERMNKVEQVDSASGTITVQSGTPLQVAQEAADAAGMLLPLDLGARGSCTIGGNLATNAGGNRVIRFGMARNMVLGLEAVLPDGTVVSNLNKFIKNNTGYDLNQLLVGSEGTLGIITRAVLRLVPKPRSQSVAFCGVSNYDRLVELLSLMKARLGPQLSAFEVLWPDTYSLITSAIEGVGAPLTGGYAYYVLVESMGTEPDSDQSHFESVLADAFEDGLIADAVIAKSAGEIEAIWRVRDSLAEATASVRPIVSFDVSLSIENMDRFATELHRRANSTWSDASVFVGGHLGDGNLHAILKAGDRQPHPEKEIETLVYSLVAELNGSISAEHGIGFTKRAYLSKSRSDAEIHMMHRIKQAFDPNNILNRGRILDPAALPDERYSAAAVIGSLPDGQND